MESIKETTYKPEDIELGGNIAQILDVANIKETVKYTVKDVSVIETEWGLRADYIIADEYAEWKISSWNLVSKKKFKASDIIGKNISLSPFKSNPKKLILEVLD